MSETIHVLVIEDNQADVDLIRELLPGRGDVRFAVEAVPRLSDALARLRTDGIDAALVDLGLPDSQGLDTFRVLRAQAPGLAIILLTGSDDQEIAVEAVRGGAQDFLVKGHVDGELLARSIRYAVERKRVGESLRKALDENRELLRELQHRAKNSFAMISSLINMAVDRVPLEARATLGQLDSRVRAMSELYTLLYAQGSSIDVRLGEYFGQVAASIAGLSGSLSLECSLEDLRVPVKEAAVLGLILTELVTNAVKYAFPGGRSGVIAVTLGRCAAGAVLEVRDDGVGMADGPEGHDGGTGLELVRGLAEQLDGDFSTESGDGGTRCVLRFPLASEGPAQDASTGLSRHDTLAG